MPLFGYGSLKNLGTCDLSLQIMAHEVIKRVDFSVIGGHRGAEEQNGFYDSGLSKVRYPDSLHNLFPSLALDFLPYPRQEEDVGTREDDLRFAYIAGQFFAEAARLGKTLRWGGDWQGTNGLRIGRGFKDLGHLEVLI